MVSVVLLGEAARGPEDGSVKILVTGGAGFIGSAFIRYVHRHTEDSVVNVDCLTYAANLAALDEATVSSRYRFEQADICDMSAMRRIFATHQPDTIVNLAAESRVDRSIGQPIVFVSTNIIGTHALVEVARCYWSELEKNRRAAFRILHVSTEDVFGSTSGATSEHTESDPRQPNSAYPACRAAGDRLVRACYQSYGLPTLWSSASSNYGPWQFPEKLIPLMIRRALAGDAPLTEGIDATARNWLHVDDHARALWLILTHGRAGEPYDVRGNGALTHVELAKRISELVDERHSAGAHPRFDEFTPDCSSPEQCLPADGGQLRRELGWQPIEHIDSGLAKTVRWYVENETAMRVWVGARYADGRLRHRSTHSCN